MNELAMTLCALASALSGGAIAWTIGSFIFNQGFAFRDRCALCSALVGKSLIERNGPTATEVVCRYCYLTAAQLLHGRLFEQEQTKAQVATGSPQTRSCDDPDPSGSS